MINSLKKLVMAAAIIVISISSFAQTSVKEAPNGWHLKDLQATGFYGISLDKAYEFVKGRKSQTVIVAIIDSGIDTTHEDLKSILWTNPKEIPGNGIDDDGNGYVDDIHGWNFLGGRDGRNVKEDSYEAARFYHNYKNRFENISDVSKLSQQDQQLYKEWKRAKADVVDGVDPAQTTQAKFIYTKLKSGDSVITKDLKKQEYSGKDLQAYTPTNADAIATRAIILSICTANNNNFDITNKMLLDELEGDLRKAETVNNPPPNYRGDIVKDNEKDINDKFYGNNDIMASTPMHGTHVAGIIGGIRNNGKGIGIADNVRIMMIRAVPDGDEHDKDIALAIRYAVDNGAKIINMSFGKSFSPQKPWVDDAVKYAESKGVLLIHAAGNDSKNLDSGYNYPSPTFLNDGQKATNWLTIGASGDPKNGGLAASFSNYGKKEVDVFAPGVNIYSTLPGGNVYGNLSGTSMASPVTAGLAAFLLEYFPTLTPQQLKMIIEKSSVPILAKTKKPSKDDQGEQVSFSELSKTGGLINAYDAVKMAAALTGKNPKPLKNKVKIKQTKKS